MLAALMFVGSWNGLIENKKFNDYGKTTLIEPIQQYTETTRTKKKLSIEVSKTTSFSAEIYFTTLDKQRIKVNKDIPKEILSRFMTGESVYIEYLPEEPTNTRFPGDSRYPISAALIGLALLGTTYFFWKKV